MMRIVGFVALSLAVLMPGGGRAQDSWPEPLRGTWALGECSAPAVLLQVNARGIARLPETGEQRYSRQVRFTTSADWLVGHGGDEQAARLLLRPRDGGLELAEPPAKLLDTELPGAATPVAQFRRCLRVGGGQAALHGEGIAFAAALDSIELACEGDAGTSDACIAALMAFADVSRDGKLGAAELARLVRGVTWLLLASEGAPLEVLAAGVGAGAAVGIGVAWLLLASYDYDGDGRLSPEEMVLDRGPWIGGAPPAFGPPPGRVAQRLLPGLPGGAMGGSGGMLRELMEAIGPYLEGLGRQ